MAELEPLVEDLPESLHVAAGAERDVWQAYGHYALVEAAVEFGLAFFVVQRVGDVAQLVAESIRR